MAIGHTYPHYSINVAQNSYENILFQGLGPTPIVMVAESASVWQTKEARARLIRARDQRWYDVCRA